MRECVKCKSNEFTNKKLVMMVNECGHPLCRNCVENLFARNVAPCHVCGKTLKKNNFWEQLFEDPFIEKENNCRRKLRKIYNLKLEDFPSLRDFNDYLEQFEVLVANLACEIDVEATEAEIKQFGEKNADLIDRNKKKLDEDQLWVLQNLKEERDMKNRLNDVHLADKKIKEEELSTVKDAKAIISELRDSELGTSELILDRERKRLIEVELEEKEKAAEKKRISKETQQCRKRAHETMSFHTAQRMSGRAFEYQPLRLITNGPPLLKVIELEEKGYLQHIRQPSKHRLAGGFTAQTGASRALFECRVDLLLL